MRRTQLTRCLSLVLSIVLILGMMGISSGTVQADVDNTTGLRYDIYDDYAVITGFKAPAGFSGALTIPATIGGVPVTQIDYYAFSEAKSLTSIAIPSSVTGLYSDFSGCAGLTAINVDSANTKYKSIDGILYSKDGTVLECCPPGKNGSVTIPSGVTSVGSCAFYGCTGLTAINVESANIKYKSIDGIVYSKDGTELYICPEGKTGSVTILSSVTYIEQYAFYGCTGVIATNVDSANTVYKSVDGIVYSKDGTELILCPPGKTGSVTIPSGVTYIWYSAFYQCAGLTSITIPSGVTNMNSDAFDECTGLAAINVDSANTKYKSIDGVLYTKDGTELFICPEGKTGSVTIPGSVTSMYSDAFNGCSALTAINVDAANTIYKSIDGVLYSKDGTDLICFPEGKAGNFTIPSGVTAILSNAFYCCTNLTGVTIPIGVTRIDYDAFYGCESLTGINIPDSVTTIRGNAFRFCNSLTRIKIGSGVTYIDEGAFWGCDKLTSAYFYGNAPEMGAEVFGDCATNFSVYYLSGKTGYSNPWEGYPATSFVSGISYQTHVQDVGWQAYVSDGAVSGTSGQSKRLEAIHIKLDGITGGIEYRTHVQDIGWQEWVENDALSGTSGQSKRLEAIQIRLTGEAATNYDVYYRVHAQNTGWMDWAKNGASSGTAGYSYRLEAIEIKLVSKDGAAPGPTTAPFIERTTTPTDGTVSYKTHVQDIGWQAYVSNGAQSGTSGQSKRLEGIQIKLANVAGGIEYSTHIQDIGWQGFVADDAMSGTSGQSKRLEAIKIRLTGAAAEAYDIYYCVHAQNTGWLDWAKNGESAGTAGFGYRLEAIKVILVPKGGPAPGATARPFVQG